MENKNVGWLETLMLVVKALDEAWDEAMASQTGEPKEGEDPPPRALTDELKEGRKLQPRVTESQALAQQERALGGLTKKDYGEQ